MAKVRVDVLLVERGLVESRSIAQRLVMAGQVRVDGQLVHKPAVKVPGNASLEIDSGPRFVSRGGEKLEAALDAFNVDMRGLACADVGASTGGFTDCLLQHGAARVYAVDVGQGILHWKLRQHPKVEVIEKTNVRDLELLAKPVDLVTIDVSFISLHVPLRVVRGWFGERGGCVIALIKPQFEAGREQANRGKGVIRDARIHLDVLTEVLGSAQALGYRVLGLIRSPLLGQKGNVEFLLHLGYPASDEPPDIPALIRSVLPDLDAQDES
jgi:23S rRNA (cytidine1920-2'-O)/16S rRNA (cytidine1409-2'-O)-methyltransferase